MANSFPRTTRSLNLDGFGFSLTLLVLSVTLILAWMAWFFQAPIAIYEISRDVTVRQDGEFLARYPVSKMERMAPGQNVVFQVEGRFQNGDAVQNGNGEGEERTLTVSGIVMKIVPPERAGEDGQVEILLTDETFFEILAQQQKDASSYKYQAQVEIESITPFTIVQRAARQYFSTTQMAPGLNVPGD